MAENSSRKVAMDSMQMREIWLETKLSQTQKIMNNNQFQQFYNKNKLNSNLIQTQNKQVDQLQDYQMYLELGYDKKELFKSSKNFQLKYEAQSNRISGTQENQIHSNQDKQSNNGNSAYSICKLITQEQIKKLEETHRNKNEVNHRLLEQKKMAKQQTLLFKKLQHQNQKENSFLYVQEQEKEDEESEEQQRSFLSPLLIKKSSINYQNKNNNSSPRINKSEASSKAISPLRIEQKKKMLNKDLILSIMTNNKSKDIYDLESEEKKYEGEQNMRKSKNHVYTRFKSMTNLPIEYGGQCESPLKLEKQPSTTKQKEEKSIAINFMKESIRNSKQQKKMTSHSHEEIEVLDSPFFLTKSKTLIPEQNDPDPLLNLSKKLSIVDFNVQDHQNFESNFKNEMINHISTHEKSIRKLSSCNQPKEHQEKIDSFFSKTFFQEKQSIKQQSQNDILNLKRVDQSSPFRIKSKRINGEKQQSEFENTPNVPQSNREQRKNFSQDFKLTDQDLNQQFVKASSLQYIQLNIDKIHDSQSPSKRGPIIKYKTVISKVKELYKFEREKVSSQSPNQNDSSNRFINKIKQEEVDQKRRSLIKISHEKPDQEKPLFIKPSFQKIEQTNFSNKSEKQFQATKFMSKGLSMKALDLQQTPSNPKTPTLAKTLKHKQFLYKINQKNNNNQIRNYFISNCNCVSTPSLNNEQGNIIEKTNKQFQNIKNYKEGAQLQINDRPYFHLHKSNNSKNDFQTQNSQTDFKDIENEKSLQSDMHNTSVSLNFPDKEYPNFKMEGIPFSNKKSVLRANLLSYQSKNVINHHQTNNSNKIQSDFLPYKISLTQSQTHDNFSDFKQIRVNQSQEGNQ